jgi:endonuclease-3
VLLFSYGRPDIPVDTHVHRVGTRLGLFRPGASLEECHDEMLRLAKGSDPYEAHVALIRHGRRTCHARTPNCGECPLRRTCPAYRVSFAKTARAAAQRPKREASDGQR